MAAFQLADELGAELARPPPASAGLGIARPAIVRCQRRISKKFPGSYARFAT
jgi:hypothetical protein